jgi:hypothetical protein
MVQSSRGTSRDEGSIRGKVARKYLAKCTVEKAEHKPTHRACVNIYKHDRENQLE